MSSEMTEENKATLGEILTNHNTRIAALENEVRVLLGIIDAQDKFNTIIANKLTDVPVIAH